MLFPIKLLLNRIAMTVVIVSLVQVVQTYGRVLTEPAFLTHAQRLRPTVQPVQETMIVKTHVLVPLVYVVILKPTVQRVLTKMNAQIPVLVPLTYVALRLPPEPPVVVGATAPVKIVIITSAHPNRLNILKLSIVLSINSKPLLAVLAFAQDCLCLVCASELCGAVGDLFAFAVFAGDDAFGAEDLFQGIKGDKGFSHGILLCGLLGVDAVPLLVHSPEIVLRVCDGHRLRGLFVLYFGTF